MVPCLLVDKHLVEHHFGKNYLFEKHLIKNILVKCQLAKNIPFFQKSFNNNIWSNIFGQKYLVKKVSTIIFGQKIWSKNLVKNYFVKNYYCNKTI
jgi:hypothetical protein